MQSCKVNTYYLNKQYGELEKRGEFVSLNSFL